MQQILHAQAPSMNDYRVITKTSLALKLPSVEQITGTKLVWIIQWLLNSIVIWPIRLWSAFIKRFQAQTISPQGLCEVSVRKWSVMIQTGKWWWGIMSGSMCHLLIYRRISVSLKFKYIKSKLLSKKRIVSILKKINKYM